MGEVSVYNLEGDEVGRVELPSGVFGVKPHQQALYEAVKAYLNNQRQGTASTKTRGEVRGGGRKPWRQKGTGRARAGSIRSPIWVGGGRAHGPKPIDYYYSIPKRVKRLAIRSAFSMKAGENKVVVLEGISFEEPKTKKMMAILKALDLLGKKVLLLTDGSDQNLLKSCRNIPRLEVRPATGVSTYDLLNAEVLLVTQGALDKIEEVFSQ